MPAITDEARRFFFSRSDAPRRDELLDVFPVRNDKSFEPELAAQNVSQDLFIDVAWNSVDLAGVDHDRACAGFDCRLECRKKIFAQVIFRNPRRRSISSG